MADSSAAPFCSSLPLSASGVLELKNFSQFALICAAASAVDPVPGLLGAAELGAAEDGGGGVGGGGAGRGGGRGRARAAAGGHRRGEREAERRGCDPASQEMESHDTPPLSRCGELGTHCHLGQD